MLDISQQDLLTLKKVSYAVAPEQSVIQSVSFSLPVNSITGLLGINGAGKSTLLSLCSGRLLPTSGSLTRPDATEIGYLPDIPPLIPDLTVEQYLSHIAKLRCLRPVAPALERVLQACDLLTRRKQGIATLSKGNRQRVGIAQAILHLPKLLLLDEPMSGLDPEQVASLRALLTDLAKTTTILFSTHTLSELDSLCDQNLILHNRTIQKIVSEPTPCFVVTLAGTLDIESATHDSDYTRCVCCTQQALQQFLARCVAQHWVVVSVQPLKNSLESAFFDAIRDTQAVHV